jgi:hypothetical protein
MIRFTEGKRLEDGSRRPVLLYGKWWSAEDADYAREIEADQSLRAPDLVRLWAENRPSVRAKAAAAVPPAVPLETVEPSGTPPQTGTATVTPFAERLAELNLSVRGAADFLNVSPTSIQKWKREGAPAEIMSQLA